MPPSDSSHHADALRVDGPEELVSRIVVPAQHAVDQEPHVARLVNHVVETRPTRTRKVRQRIVGGNEDVAVAGEVPRQIGPFRPPGHEAVAVDDQRKAVRRPALPRNPARVRIRRIADRGHEPPLVRAGEVVVRLRRATPVDERGVQFLDLVRPPREDLTARLTLRRVDAGSSEEKADRTGQHQNQAERGYCDDLQDSHCRTPIPTTHGEAASTWHLRTANSDCNVGAVIVASSLMGQLTIRNVDEAVVQALRRRAAAAGRSTEEEARRSLAMAVGVDREAARARLDAVRAAIAHDDDEPVEQLVRKLRDGRAHDISG